MSGMAVTLDEAVEEALTILYKENQHALYQISTEAMDERSQSTIYAATIFPIYNISTNAVCQITADIDKATTGAVYDPR